MGLTRVSFGEKAPVEVNVVIEIPMNAPPVKYEVDKESGVLFVDRFLSTSMLYPTNYGYIPETLSEDGDPVDVLVITPHPVTCGAVIRSRIIGMLNMTDESGEDAKLIAVPVNKLSGLYENVHKHTDLPKSMLQTIEHFFTHYKDLEPGKWVKVNGWGDVDAAHKEIMNSIERYKE